MFTMVEFTIVGHSTPESAGDEAQRLVDAMNTHFDPPLIILPLPYMSVVNRRGSHIRERAGRIDGIGPTEWQVRFKATAWGGYPEAR